MAKFYNITLMIECKLSIAAAQSSIYQTNNYELLQLFSALSAHLDEGVSLFLPRIINKYQEWLGWDRLGHLSQLQASLALVDGQLNTFGPNK